jgi:hypothetical protein
VYWGLLAPGRFPSAFALWSNTSQHALNSFCALFEIISPRTSPLPWLDIIPILGACVCYTRNGRILRLRLPGLAKELFRRRCRLHCRYPGRRNNNLSDCAISHHATRLGDREENGQSWEIFQAWNRTHGSRGTREGSSDDRS